MENPTRRGSGPWVQMPGVIAVAVVLLTTLAAPVLAQTFLAPDINVTEGDDATFRITLPIAYNGNVRWEYATENGTATSGDDYTAVSGHVVISSGSTTASVVVQTAEDDVADDEETFKLKLSNFQTQGFSAGSNAWTSAYRLQNVPTEKTMTATIDE